MKKETLANEILHKKITNNESSRGLLNTIYPLLLKEQKGKDTKR